MKKMAVLLVMGESATNVQDLENTVQAVELWCQEVPWEPYFQVSLNKFSFHHSFFPIFKKKKIVQGHRTQIDTFQTTIFHD